MTWEWTYSGVLREDGWAGNYGGAGSVAKTGKAGGDKAAAVAGKAAPGRMIGGNVEAETEAEARQKIKEIHTKKRLHYNPDGSVKETEMIEPDIEFTELTKKTAIIHL
ncbi:MAG TPA: hypothetical protein VK673_21995 [Chthoniobacterales bacterium]|nr:hypothetical protein [Chthoniobacterales bacterium]